MRIDWDVPIAMDDVLSYDPCARPAGIFGGTTTLSLHDSYVHIPVIP